MNEPEWILPNVVKAVHQILIAEHGGLSGVRDDDLLDSAMNRPQQLFSYGNEISIFDLAASYSYGLAMNHPFVDGNKRVALTVAAIFLEINGYSLDATEPEAVVIFEQLAAGELPEKNLSIWFQDSSIFVA
ncbi:MAG: type II toxin-antitoxin system death-on-curing family toxin [endosymbiont of Escarpia spicata]|uniref:Type II toxin-antitoxin system death-on-curing family toxin n=1 Tax=endosymbiont of Escarpia spicata TaxID=2200908 RepID=A0A370DR38_9GAMM|nr:MAG: type II toxin-antitoxin system death-on-curing family toxin [endosymbiont of Escarpia spicata]